MSTLPRSWRVSAAGPAFAAAVALVLVPPRGDVGEVWAQEPSPPGSLVGVVYDSTVSGPLEGARVAVIGTSSTVLTEADGSFRMDGVPIGHREVTFWHPRLEELGVGPPAVTFDLRPGDRAQVELAVPSTATLERMWCSLEHDGYEGTRLVAGVVRDSVTGVPLPGARVVLRELGADWNGRDLERDTRTGPGGTYRFCHVGEDHDLTVEAGFGAESSRAQHMAAGTPLSVQRDIVLSVSRPGDLQGVVIEAGTDRPVPGAEVTLEGTGRVAVSGPSGGFALRDVPPGLHLLTTRHLAYESRTDSVTLLGDEGVGLRISLSHEPIPLGPLEVTVRAPRNAFDPATMGTRFDGLTRSEIDAILPRINTMDQLLRQARVPGLSVRRVTIRDGVIQLPALCIETVRRQASNPNECNMVEVYVDDVRVQTPEHFLGDMDPQTVDRIQLLSALEAGSRYARDSRNSVLLIWTRGSHR